MRLGVALVALAVASTRCAPSERRPAVVDSTAQIREAPQPHAHPPSPLPPPPAVEPSGAAVGENAQPSDDAERWVIVLTSRGGATGAWATASFDAERNKITIRTNDADRFTLDVGRIPIDWERPVVLGIDGRNSELRRRERTLLHFRRDGRAGWVVEEE